MEQLPPLAAPAGRPIRLLQITDLHHFGLAEGHTSLLHRTPRHCPDRSVTDGDELSAEQTPGNYSLGRGIAVSTPAIPTTMRFLGMFLKDCWWSAGDRTAAGAGAADAGGFLGGYNRQQNVRQPRRIDGVRTHGNTHNCQPMSHHLAVRFRSKWPKCHLFLVEKSGH